MVTAIAMILNPAAEPPEMVTVPTVTGVDQPTAENFLKNEGLVPQIEEVVGTEEDEGRVLEQLPAAGDNVEKGSTVLLKVSQGPDTSAIPPIIGLTKNDARQALNDAGFNNLEFEDANPADEDIKATAGTVTDSSPPEGGEVDPEDLVTVILATGESIVPALVEETELDAKELAQDAGFDNVTVEPEESAEVEAGTVLRQGPEAGTPLARTETITITVAKEVEVTELQVPNLRGYTEADARDVLTKTGFTTEPTITLVETDEEKPGFVFAQVPLANELLDPAGAIEIRIAEVPEIVEEPTPDPPAEPVDPPVVPPEEGEDG